MLKAPKIIEFIKKHGVKISPIEPTTSEAVWIKKGKNLFNPNSTKNVWIENGVEAPNPDWTFSDFIEVNSNTDYIESSSLISGQTLGQVKIVEYNSNKAYVTEHYSSNAVQLSVTTTSTTKYIRCGYRNARQTNIQLEQNSTATTFETYINKEVYVKNDNGIYEKYMNAKQVDVGEFPSNNAEVWFKKGKNLIDFSKCKMGCELYSTDGGIWPSPNYYVTDFIEIKGGETYTASGLSVTNRAYYTENLTYISRTTTATAVAPSNAKYVVCCSLINGYSHPQLEQGSVATNYESYVEKEIYYKNNNGIYEKFTNVEEYDTGWIPISFTSDKFAGRTGYEPKYRQIGNVVYITGQIVPLSPTANLTNYTLTNANIPKPKYQATLNTSSYDGVMANVWLANNSIAIRTFGVTSSSVGFQLDTCYIAD